jgi:hypothetical protein
VPVSECERHALGFLGRVDIDGEQEAAGQVEQAQWSSPKFRLPAAGRRPAPARRPSRGRTGRVRCGPLRRHMVRCVRGTEREVEEERLARCGLLLVKQQPYRRAGQVLGQVVAVFRPGRRVDVVVVLHQVRRPLVGVALQESVEALEPQAQRPAPERPGGTSSPPRAGSARSGTRPG